MAFVFDVEHRDGGRFCSNECSALGFSKKCPDPTRLVVMYVQGASMNTLSREFGVSDMTIKKWLEKQGITTRSMSEAVSLAQTGKKHSPEWNAAIKVGIRRTVANGKWGNRACPIENWKNGGRSRGGFRADLGRYFRSGWEADFGRYLNRLLEQKAIAGWEYEPQTFEFRAIKRGVRFYTPDFRVMELDGSHKWFEVKGFFDQRSKTRAKRMAKYFPSEKVTIIDRSWFSQMVRCGAAGAIGGWETMRPNGGRPPI
jgi:hypothetical protein